VKVEVILSSETWKISRVRKSSESMRAGALHFLLTSKSYIHYMSGWLIAYPPAKRWLLVRFIFDPEDEGNTFL
jgi:hypothetical protein